MEPSATNRCPTCDNPVGGSIKALREERDRLLPFVTQWRQKREELAARERDLKLRADHLDERGIELDLREKQIRLDEAALETLSKEANLTDTADEYLETTQRLERDLHATKEALMSAQGLAREAEDALALEKQRRAELEENLSHLKAEAAQSTLKALIEHNLEILDIKEKATEELEKFRSDANRRVSHLDQVLEIEKKLKKEAEGKLANLKGEIARLAVAREKLDLEIHRLNRQHEEDQAQVVSLRNKVVILKVQNLDYETDLMTIRREKSQAEEAITALSIELSKLRLKGGLGHYFSFRSIEVLKALSDEISEEFNPPKEVVTLGTGGIDEGDFDEYLRGFGIEPCSEGCDCIIVGRSGWSKHQLDLLIENADPEDVRVYSQELFIAGLLTKHDPFSLPSEVLLELAKGHPALEYLITTTFEWPQVIAGEELGEPIYLRGASVGLESESPLYRMNYRVGNVAGLPRSNRRKILERAFEEEIPAVGDKEYMAEWGSPRSQKRLWRIAHHIAWLIRSRQSNPSMAYAVDDWNEDFEWLKDKFYLTSMRFSWPFI